MKKIISFLSLFIMFLSFSFICCDSGIISNRAEAVEVKKVNAFHILVPTEKQAIEIRNEILQGKDQKEVFDNFYQAAKKYSKCPSGQAGGSLGWFGRGDMVPSFEKAAFSLPKFEVSEPVKTDYGWHLIYVIDKR